MSPPRTVVWFRGKDLRVADHAPLRDAAATGEVIPLFVLDPHFFAPERARPLAHRMQYLVDALHDLAASLAALGSRLVVVPGRSVDVVPALAKRWRADRVVAQRWTAPLGRARDAKVSSALGHRFVLHDGETLAPPGSVRSGSGTPYRVFTPFAKALRATVTISRPWPVPTSLPAVPDDVAADGVALPTCETLGFARNDRVLRGGETAAEERLRVFLRDGLGAYATHRDRMDLAGTSRLSADLKFGTLSPRRVWTAASDAGGGASLQSFLNELCWREFAHATLWDHPELLDEPFQPAWKGFPWRTDEAAWEAWVHGRTGYPVVDAAARQLLAEGHIHNRARMVAASFLAKHLLLDFRRGEDHWLRHLTDGDWAQNDAGWQWSAGCGCDAQPWFRVFNPVAQGERFDPDGAYVKRWVPELANVPSKWVHRPDEAPPLLLRSAGVRLGVDYPRPIVDHAMARARFLATARAHLGRGDGDP